MESKLEFSTTAAQDIDRLLDDSLRKFGADQTEKYFESLRECLNMLSNNPQAGTGVDQIRQGYRYFPHESHVIFYQQSEFGIFVVRILHKRMDALSWLN
jgi:toxin ParE1/3/4